jgi:hypothetical protein
MRSYEGRECENEKPLGVRSIEIQCNCLFILLVIWVNNCERTLIGLSIQTSVCTTKDLFGQISRQLPI